MKATPLKEWLKDYPTMTEAAACLGVTKQNLSYCVHKVKTETFVLDVSGGFKLVREVPLKKAP